MLMFLPAILMTETFNISNSVFYQVRTGQTCFEINFTQTFPECSLCLAFLKFFSKLENYLGLRDEFTVLYGSLLRQGCQLCFFGRFSRFKRQLELHGNRFPFIFGFSIFLNQLTHFLPFLKLSQLCLFCSFEIHLGLDC